MNRQKTEKVGFLRIQYFIAAFSIIFLICNFVYAEGASKVLVLNSYHRGYHWSDGLMDGIQAEFSEMNPGVTSYLETNPKLFFEYLDTMRCDPNIVFPAFARLMQTKYKNIKFDVIISCSNNSLAFLRVYRSELFPNVPVVFVGVNLFEDWMIKGLEPVTGICHIYDKEATIETALKFHPLAKQIVLVRNKDRDYAINFEGIIRHFEGRAKFVFLDISTMTFEQFVNKLAEYGNESIVLFSNFLSDSSGTVYTDKMVTEVFRRCAAPVYINAFSFVGRGPVGGSINYGVHHGKLAASVAIRILNGENAEDIPIMRKGPTDYMFDYNQLKRFGISLSQLPPESIVINEPKSFYDEHKKQIWIFATAFITLSTIILILSANILRRKRVERKLLEYQAQLKSLASELSLTEERERRRIATELHDDICQSLVISKVMLEQLQKSASHDNIDGVIDDVRKMLSQTIEKSRLLTFDLGSPILYELGFEAAVAELLTEQLRKHKIAAELVDDGQIIALDDDIRGFLFRTVRELLINIIKHANAHKVKVLIRKLDGEISICVEDDGVGFDQDKVKYIGPTTGGFGLFSIRERLEQLGGRIEIESSPGRGCAVTVTVPLKSESPIEETKI